MPHFDGGPQGPGTVLNKSAGDYALATGLSRKQGKYAVDLTIVRFKDGSLTTVGPMRDVNFEYLAGLQGDELGS